MSMHGFDMVAPFFYLSDRSHIWIMIICSPKISDTVMLVV